MGVAGEGVGLEVVRWLVGFALLILDVVVVVAAAEVAASAVAFVVDTE